MLQTIDRESVKKQFPILSVFLQVFLIWFWMTALSDTESFFSAYSLTAFIGLFSVIDNAQKPFYLSKVQFVGCFLCSLAISLFVILAEYRIFYTFDLRCFLCWLGGFLAIWNIHILILKTACLQRSVRPVFSSKVLFLSLFAFISVVDLLYLFLIAYPGVLSGDSVATVLQISQGSYNNTMPFWHTMFVKLFFETGLFLFRDINAAIAFFHCIQIFILAFCMAYSVVTIYESGAPSLYVCLCIFIYALLPYNIVYSVTLWKDVLFGASALLMITALFRILNHMGRHAPVAFFIGSFGFCLMRTNGWVAFLLVFLCAFFSLRKAHKKLLVFLFIILLLSGFMTGPLISAMNIPQTDLVEAFAVPFQQVARYIIEDGWLDEVETEQLSMAFDLDKVKELYHPNGVDPIKFGAFRYENVGYIKEYFHDYLSLYLLMWTRNPEIMAEAWIEQTKGFWNSGYADPMYDIGVVGNTLGIVHTPPANAVLSRIDQTIQSWRSVPQLLEPLHSIGLHVWILMVCFVVNLTAKKKAYLLCIPCLVLAVGLWFGTPVFAEFRYAYPILLSVPLILAVTLFHTDTPQS